MIFRKRKGAVIASIIAILLVVGGLTYNAFAENLDSDSDTVNSIISPDTSETSETSDTTAADIPSTGEYDEEDTVTTYDESTATVVTLQDDGTTVEGEGVTVQNNTVTITAGGTYILNGTLSDGQVVVNSTDDATVKIVLNGVTLTNATTAAISVSQAEKTIITTAEGSENTVSTTTESFAETDEANAAIYSEDDLVFNGNGTLTVNATAGNGIQSKDDLKITSGTYVIDSQNEAIKGKDSVQILDGTFTLTTESDGIQSTNAEESDKGYIIIDGGTFTINSETDGIQAETTLTVNDADIDINTNASGTVDSEASYKGLKASGDLVISGGIVTINAVDDTIHSNANVTINGGTLTLTSRDDGIHADETTTIVGGTIDILDSYEGIEGSNVVIQGGVITITASDDGINAAGGSTTNESDGSTAAGPFGQDSFQGNSGDYSIVIEGGTVTVNAEGDGIDSNGDITMTGGTVIVNGPTSNGNAALDYDGIFSLDGGTLYALGTSDMAQTADESSAQASIQIWLNSARAAGEVVTVTDSNGNEVASVTSEKTFSNIIVSSEAITVGETYIVTFSSGSSVEVTTSSTVTSISESGEAATTNQGQMMPGGGQGQQQQRTPGGP